MQKHYLFHGFVYPQGHLLSIDSKPSFEWKKPDAPYNLKLNIEIKNSVITANAFVSSDDSKCFTNAYARVCDMARAVVDMVAFKLGDGLNVAILEWSEFGSTKREGIRINEPALAPIIHSMDASEHWSRALQIVCSDSRLILAMRDLVEAVNFNHQAAINCARAIEGLRHIISPAGTDSEAWEALRNSLNIDREFLTYITKNPVRHRHGDRILIDSDTIKEILKRSWLIMDRFLELKLNNVQALPLADFPLLKD